MNMNEKLHILEKLTEIFNRWQELLTDLSEEQILEPLMPSTWTVKDVIAHLWSWQQASLARAEAALQNTRPTYPRWWEINGPDPDEDVGRTNAWLYEASKDKPWSMVYTDWKVQFEHYLELTQKIPEKDLLEPGRYAWMGDYPLVASPLGALDHHLEHYDTLTAWLQDDGR
jgi:hypothetical protein